MVNISRDFESELLHELKFFARCTRKSKDPNHFCSNREFQKNLRMSPRDVGKNLSNLVTQGKITHDQVTYNGKQRDKFTVIDPRMYSSKDIIGIYKGYINDQLVQLEFHADKMKKRPAYYDVEMTPLRPFPQLQVFESGKYPMIPQTTLKSMRRPTQMTSKINEKGFEYFLNGFVDDDDWHNLSNNNIIKIAEQLAEYEPYARVDSAMWEFIELDNNDQM